MNSAFSLIFTGENDFSLKELTALRPVAAVPIGGRYRLIDVLLSNLVHSKIQRIGIIAQKNYNSLMTHCGSGKEWDLNRKKDGLTILPPFSTRENTGKYRGLLDGLINNVDFINDSKQKYVVIMQTHIAYNFNYQELIDFHVEKGADITLLYDTPVQFAAQSGVDRAYLDVSPEGWVNDVTINLKFPHTDKVHMDICVMSKQTLQYIIDLSLSYNYSNFKRDILQNDSMKFKIAAMEYNGYTARIDSIENYFNFHMEIIKPEIYEQLFDPNHPIYTRVKDEVPAKYTGNPIVKNSLVADGCIIEGNVENSVIFRGVKIEQGAQVKNCVLMEDVVVRKNSYLENVIADKRTYIKENMDLRGAQDHPFVIAKHAKI